MKEFNYEEIKEIRKALALAIEKIDAIVEEDRFYLLENLYDKFRDEEERLEEEN